MIALWDIGADLLITLYPLLATVGVGVGASLFKSGENILWKIVGRAHLDLNLKD